MWAAPPGLRTPGGRGQLQSAPPGPGFSEGGTAGGPYPGRHVGRLACGPGRLHGYRQTPSNARFAWAGPWIVNSWFITEVAVVTLVTLGTFPGRDPYRGFSPDVSGRHHADLVLCACFTDLLPPRGNPAGTRPRRLSIGIEKVSADLRHGPDRALSTTVSPERRRLTGEGPS
jgi:hypothetical protein